MSLVYEERGAQAERMAAKRRAARDIPFRAVKDRKRRDSLKDDDCEWLSTYLPHVFYHPFTAAGRKMVEEIGSALRFGIRKCRAEPRGTGKSTAAKYLSMKYGLERIVEFTLILAATGDKSHDMLADIKRQLRSPRNKLLREDYPLETDVARYVGTAPAKANNVTVGGRSIRVEWQQDLIVLPSYEDEGLGGIMMALGITSDAVQGCNYNDIRPSFVILDDLDSRDSLAAADGKIAGKIETIIDHTVAGLGGPGKRLGQAMLCTIPSRRSVAFIYSDPEEKPAWSGVRVARILKWPTNKQLWEEYIFQRKKGQAEKGPNGKPIDPLGRIAHKLYADNRAAMDEGAELSNEYDFETDPMPDGTPKHLSALQKCYDYIADNGLDSFLTEHQNDPPPDEAEGMRLGLTSHHIEFNCISGHDRRIVPDGNSKLTIGVDIRKLGLNYVALSSTENAVGSIIDYDFFSFGTEDKPTEDCELAILAGLWAWHAALQEFPYTKADGEIIDIDMVLIDMGWKDESWATQPVQVFCAQLGAPNFLASKGIPNYRRPQPDRFTVIGENWYWRPSNGFVGMNGDHWKLKVHEGFLCDRSQPGAISLFNHEQIDGRMDRNTHRGFAKHILAESWETKLAPGFKRPETKWWHYGKPNHYLDATYQALVARSVAGVNVLSSVRPQAAPATAAVTSERTITNRRRINFRRRS